MYKKTFASDIVDLVGCVPPIGSHKKLIFDVKIPIAIAYAILSWWGDGHIASQFAKTDKWMTLVFVPGKCCFHKEVLTNRENRKRNRPVSMTNCKIVRLSFKAVVVMRLWWFLVMRLWWWVSTTVWTATNPGNLLEFRNPSGKFSCRFRLIISLLCRR